MGENKCEGCTACCEAFDIVELNKPHSTACSFCKNSGCSIWDKKPVACNTFSCLYLQEEMPKELRPDNCKVIFEKLTTKIYLALSHHKDENAYREKNVMEFIKDLNDQGISVVTSSYGHTAEKEIFVGEGHTQEGVANMIKRLINGST